MFDSLFPDWSNPGALAAIVGLRVGLNLCFVALAADAAGLRSRLTAAIGALTVLSTAIQVLALRPGVLGLRASYVEVLAQVAVVLCAGYAVYANPTTSRSIAFALALVGALALLALMIPIYGEAFVAP